MCLDLSEKPLSCHYDLPTLRHQCSEKAYRFMWLATTCIMSKHIEKLGETISSCELVIETTADSAVFRMAAAICTQKKKPLVWARVYAGGIGGLVARSVPAEDPSPIYAADQLRA